MAGPASSNKRSQASATYYAASAERQLREAFTPAEH